LKLGLYRIIKTNSTTTRGLINQARPVRCNIRALLYLYVTPTLQILSHTLEES
jgi:hypothetical protein